MLGWARCSFHKRHTQTRYDELVLLHPLGYVGHLLRSSAVVCPGREMSMHYFSCSGGAGTDST
jgi:hypothetical protein